MGTPAAKGSRESDGRKGIVLSAQVNAATAGVTFSTIRSLDELAGVATEWDELVAAAPRPSPFLLHAWLEEWWRHYGGDRQLAVHAAVRAGRLVAALPLYVDRSAGLRVAGYVGDETANFADVLLARDEPEPTAAALVGRAERESAHDFALLHGLSSGSRLERFAGNLALVQRVEAPVLDLSRGWETVYREKTTSKKRNLHARRRKQLQRLGHVETRLARTREEIDAVLDDTFRIHELRWAGRYDGSGYATATGRSFHRAAVRRLADRDLARILTLELDGRPIAFHYYLAFCGRMYVHRLAFDPRYAATSPGLVNTLDALEAAAAEGLRRVEYLGSADRYKVELSDGFDPIHDAFGLARTPQGRLAASGLRRSLELRLRLKQSDRFRAAYLAVRRRMPL